MSAKVIVRDLQKRYGGNEAVRGVSFEVAEGEVFGLLGPNGAGKTTTVECLLGLRVPDAGSIAVCGIDALAEPRRVKQKIGAALQTTALQDKITPREAVQLFGSCYSIRAAPEQLLDRFALTEKADAPFDSLSGGQRQRLALALAFVNRPEVIFLDEPTAGLDAHSRKELHHEIAQMKRDGHTVLLTTHNMEEAEQLCDRIAIIHCGRIVKTGTPGELIAGSSSVAHVDLIVSHVVDAGSLSRIFGLTQLSCDGVTVTFQTTNATATLQSLTQLLADVGVEIVDLRVRKASLEEVFLALTGAVS